MVRSKHRSALTPHSHFKPMLSNLLTIVFSAGQVYVIGGLVVDNEKFRLDGRLA